MNNDSVGKKIVEALKKQAENIDMEMNSNSTLFNDTMNQEEAETDMFDLKDEIFSEKTTLAKQSFFENVETEKEPVFTEPQYTTSAIDIQPESFEMPSNILVLKKLISQLPSGVSRHTGAQIIKQTMEALGISMKSVLQDAQQVQETLKASARECQGSIQEYKKQILTLEKQSQNYQKQYSALNDLISLFIQTTK